MFLPVIAIDSSRHTPYKRQRHRGLAKHTFPRIEQISKTIGLQPLKPSLAPAALGPVMQAREDPVQRYLGGWMRRCK